MRFLDSFGSTINLSQTFLLWSTSVWPESGRSMCSERQLQWLYHWYLISTSYLVALSIQVRRYVVGDERIPSYVMVVCCGIMMPIFTVSNLPENVWRSCIVIFVSNFWARTVYSCSCQDRSIVLLWSVRFRRRFSMLGITWKILPRNCLVMWGLQVDSEVSDRWTIFIFSKIQVDFCIVTQWSLLVDKAIWLQSTLAETGNQHLLLYTKGWQCIWWLFVAYLILWGFWTTISFWKYFIEVMPFSDINRIRKGQLYLNCSFQWTTTFFLVWLL